MSGGMGSGGATQHKHEHALKVGKKGEITLIKATKVRDTVL